VKALGVLLAMAVALTLQSTLAGMSVGAGASVNLVLVAVVYVALAFGPVVGLSAGAIGGLAQDALSGGIVGIGGFAKTLIGFMVGVLGAQFIVSQPLSRFIMFVAATIVHDLCFQAAAAAPVHGAPRAGGAERRDRDHRVPGGGSGAGPVAAATDARGEPQ
jgi:rod shape-determining protein MreD